MLSVVVPTYRRPDLLVRCLDSLLADESVAEIIVADDCSSPAARNCAPARLRDSSRINWIAGERVGPAGNRNRGWRAARGDLIGFIDDDCAVAPGWGAAILRAVTTHEEAAGIEGLTSPEHAYDPIMFHSIASGPGAHLTCNIVFRRTALERVGGLDEEYPFPHGEDLDICARIEETCGPIVHAPAARAVHAVMPAGVAHHIKRTQYDPSTFRFFVLHPEAFRRASEALRVLPLIRSGRPTRAAILAYVIAYRLKAAIQMLQSQEPVKTRLLGCVTYLACAGASLLHVREDFEAYTRASDARPLRRQDKP